MNIILIWLFFVRDFIVRNFMVSPKAIQYNDKLIYFISYWQILYYFLRMLPFGIIRTLFGLFKISIIYQLDSIYNITNVKNNHIIPIMLKFNFIKNHHKEEHRQTPESLSDPNSFDFLSQIKFYNGNIPLSFVINNNNLNYYQKINLKYVKKGLFIDKLIDVSNYVNQPIYKLFEN